MRLIQTPVLDNDNEVKVSLKSVSRAVEYGVIFKRLLICPEYIVDRSYMYLYETKSYTVLFIHSHSLSNAGVRPILKK